MSSPRARLLLQVAIIDIADHDRTSGDGVAEGRRSLNVTPSGKVLPCHAAETIAGLEFWNVRDHSLAEIWADSPGFKAFRGAAWMKEP